MTILIIRFNRASDHLLNHYSFFFLTLDGLVHVHWLINCKEDFLSSSRYIKKNSNQKVLMATPPVYISRKWAFLSFSFGQYMYRAVFRMESGHLRIVLFLFDEVDCWFFCTRLSMSEIMFIRLERKCSSVYWNRRKSNERNRREEERRRNNNSFSFFSFVSLFSFIRIGFDYLIISLLFSSLSNRYRLNSHFTYHN